MSNFDANTGRLPLSWHLRSGEQLQSWSSEARWHFYWHTSVDWQPNRQRGIAGVPGARNQHIALQIERPALKSKPFNGIVLRTAIQQHPVASAAFLGGISINSAAGEAVNYFDLCATTHE